jgi:chaperonin cofactor prefoldin
MRNNQTNITRLQKDMDRVMEQIEKLKDKVRANGSH